MLAKKLHSLPLTGYFLIIGCLCLPLLMGCSEADTLGNEPPDEVIISGIPTWDDGIRQLVVLKCANCHTIPLTDFSPNNTPTHLDLSMYETNLTTGIQGADTLKSWIDLGILDGPVVVGDKTVSQMPLDYSLQLTAREKEYLKDWIADGLRKN